MKVTSMRAMRLAAILSACGGACALGDVPAVLDRVPESAPVIVTVDNIEKFVQRAQKFTDALELPVSDDEDDPMKQLEKLRKQPGVNVNGSGAVVAFPKNPKDKPAAKDVDDMMDEESTKFMNEDADGVVIVPITNFADFVKGMNGPAGVGGDGVVSGMHDGEEVFMRDLGGGYAGMSDKREALEKFPKVEGQMGAHKKRLGANGMRIAEGCSALVIGNIEQLGDQLTEMRAKMREDAKENARNMPGMEGVEQAMKTFELIVGNFQRDAQVGVLGIGAAEDGMWIDLGTQFKEGSEVAKLFDTKEGNAGAAFRQLPTQDYLYAASFDTRSPGIKHIIREAGKMQEGAAGKEGGSGISSLFVGMDFTRTIDTTDAVAMAMGLNPQGMMGGLFNNTIVYTETKDPAKHIDTIKTMMNALNGQTANGLTMKVDYTDDAMEVGGAKVDTYSLIMKADPKDPEAGQMQMVMSMIFGSSGMNGLVAPGKNGVYTVMSNNSRLLGAAVDDAKRGNGMAGDETFAALSKKLPPNRTIEAWIGTKGLMETVQGVMAMMGGAEFEIPAKVSPIAIGASTSSGGMHARAFIPVDTINAFSKMSEAMKPQGQVDDMVEPEADDEDSGAPKF